MHEPDIITLLRHAQRGTCIRGVAHLHYQAGRTSGAETAIMPDYTTMPDERLMGRFAARLDRAAFDELVGRFTRPAQAVASRRLGDRGLAEDAVQETFLRVVRARDRYECERPFASWFYAILRNVLVDLSRRQERHREAVDRLAARTPPEAAVVMQPPVPGSSADDLLRRLPVGERDVLVLRVIEDLPFRDVAAALGISEEAAKKRAQRGLARLREDALTAAKAS